MSPDERQRADDALADAVAAVCTAIELYDEISIDALAMSPQEAAMRTRRILDACRALSHAKAERDRLIDDQRRERMEGDRND